MVPAERHSLLRVEPRFPTPILLTRILHRNRQQTLENFQSGDLSRVSRARVLCLATCQTQQDAAFPVATVQFGCLGRSVLDKLSPSTF